MAHLFNRNVLLALSGGIAAYKSAELTRLLQQQGANVRVIMSHGACEFITPLTLQALSGHPVHTQLLDPTAEQGMGHIELARWADIMLVAPATADTLARLRSGRADDLLTTVALATAAPLMVAPAMNQQMWSNPVTAGNVAALAQHGVHIIGPASGVQACGDTGPGRMEEPDAIVTAVSSLFDTGALAGQRVLITAGPTQEALDPVRYISNNSSGKMGYALAGAAIDAGAAVTLVSGPVELAPVPQARMLHVKTAVEMLERCSEQASQNDIFIACAAVADYRPAELQAHKIKKSSEHMSLDLVRNPDIVSTIAALPDAPFTVGFAAETDRVLEHAREKMARKKLDMIIANDVSDPEIGFHSDLNAVSVLWSDGQVALETARKQAIAREIIDLVAGRCGDR